MSMIKYSAQHFRDILSINRMLQKRAKPVTKDLNNLHQVITVPDKNNVLRKL